MTLRENRPRVVYHRVYFSIRRLTGWSSAVSCWGGSTQPLFREAKNEAGGIGIGGCTCTGVVSSLKKETYPVQQGWELICGGPISSTILVS